MKRLIVLVCIMVLFACSSPSQIKLGAILVLSEDSQAYAGIAMKEGIDLAIGEVNLQGGIKGIPLTVIYQDSKLDLKEAVNSAHHLLEVESVSAAFVSTAQETLAVGSLFENAQTPLIAVWDSNAAIEDLGNHSFGTGLWAQSAGERIAGYAFKELGHRKIAIIHENHEWSQSVANYFEAQFDALGGDIVSSHSVNADEVDYRTVISKALSDYPDAIFIPLTSHIPIFLKQYQELGGDATILSSDAMSNAFIDLAGEASEGIYYSNGFTPQDIPLRDMYVAKYGHEHEYLYLVGLGYDAARVVIEGLKNSENTGESLTHSISKTQDIQGAFGNISIDERGSFRRQESIIKVENGEEILVDP